MLSCPNAIRALFTLGWVCTSLACTDRTTGQLDGAHDGEEEAARPVDGDGSGADDGASLADDQDAGPDEGDELTGGDPADGGGDQDGDSLSDADGSDGGSPDAFVATVSVPLREALLVYARNRFQADTDEEALRPYLAYVDQLGQVIDPYLYDTFVFLDLDLILTEHPTIEAWRRFMDVFFEHTPAPQIARPVVSQRAGSRAALLSGNGQSVAQTGIPVVGGGTFAWEVFTRASSEVSGREALLGAVVYDAQSNPIADGVTGLAWSDYLNQWYRYLPSGPRWRQHRDTFTLPANAASLDLQILQFLAPEEQIWVDRVQLLAGGAPLSFEDAISSGFATLLQDGDFEAGTPWSDFVPGDGLERSLHVVQANKSVAQGPLPVTGEHTYTLAAWVRADQESSDHEALLGVRVFDTTGVELTTGVNGLSYSTYTRPPMFYRYADATSSWGMAQATFELPAQAASLEIYLVNWAGDELWFDQVQLVFGDTASSDADLKVAGYRTLIHDGSAEAWHTAAWWNPTDQPLQSGSGLLPALAQVASALEDSRKRNVILGLPVGVGFGTQADFGEVNGQWVDLTRVADQQVALSWFIDDTISRWNSAPPPGLDLLGFYWMHEARQQDAALAAFVRGRVEGHGLMLTSSPYRAFMGSSACFGSSFNPEFASRFHRVWQQPNVWPPGRWSLTEEVWNNVNNCLCAPLGLEDFLTQVGYPACELATVDTFIDQLQTSCEAILASARVHANIEWVPGLEPTLGHGRVLDYLNTDATLDHDLGRFPDRMWFEDAGFGHRCALNPDPVFRAQYDAVHDFIMATRARHGFPAPTSP